MAKTQTNFTAIGLNICHSWRGAFVAMGCLLLTACSSVPEPTSYYPEHLHHCTQELINFKNQVKQENVTDAQYMWLEKYPHLAFDRFSLSLVDTLSEPQNRAKWLEYTTQKATEQRSVEFSNLSSSQFNLDRLDDCAQKLSSFSQADQIFWQRLLETPPDFPSDYQLWQKIVGVYPIAKIFAQSSINAEKQRLLQGMKEEHDNPIIQYVPSPHSHSSDPLEFAQELKKWLEPENLNTGKMTPPIHWPLLNSTQTKQLLHHFAPSWQVETLSQDDNIGHVTLNKSAKPIIDTTSPTMYSYLSYTRFYGEILVQLNYNVWFPRRSAKSHFDPYAGDFDAVLVRLTLNRNGDPYILDSIHSCGCYHMVFNLDPSLTFSELPPDPEPPLTLTAFPDKKPLAPTITLSAKEHMITQVSWLPVVNAKPITFAPYHQLKRLPVHKENTDNKTKSLFDSNGMLMASARAERWFLWPFGVPSPGTMRITGHHATAFIGERHFDDAFIFEPFFVPPSAPKP